MAKVKCVVCGRQRPAGETITIVATRSLHLAGGGVVIPRGVGKPVCAEPSCTGLLHKVEIVPPPARGR